MDSGERLLAARLRLMLDEPYLAAALARLPFVDASTTDWCPTMATDGYHIFYNVGFLSTLSDDEQRFVIAHELFHCVLGHLDRRGSRRRIRWNIAIDYATNALLVAAGLPMPDVGLFSRDYAGMTAEQIYDALPDRPDRSALGRLPISASGDQDQWSKGTSFDVHLDPEDERARMFGDACERALSPEERRRLRIVLGDDLLKKLQGTAAGKAVAEVRAAQEPSIRWEALLSRFWTGLRRADYRLFPCNHKHVWRGLYLPSVGSPGPQHLVTAVDTSGSMSERDLSLVAGELDALRAVSGCMLTALQFDTEITHVDTFEAHQSTRLGASHRFAGRGGTDITAPFNWVEQEIRKGRMYPAPDAVIVFTDGYGPMPPREPVWPVLWIATASAVPSFPFGTVIRMPGHLCARTR